MNNKNVVNLVSVIKSNSDMKILEDGMVEYKLQLKETSTFTGASSIIKRFSFGEENQLIGRARKTILFMGATGMGKTTWINAMINYILGVEWSNDFRFKLVDEEVRGASQAHSQTQNVTAYDIHYREGFRIPYSLTIVDTPGFGDTQGMERDREITSAIQEFFEDSNGIQELDAVGFAVKCSDARLTIQQKHVFNSVLSIFGKNVKENIRFLINFNEGRSPLVLDAIKEAKLPCLMDSNGSPCHQKFNNGSIFVKPSDDDDMGRIEWKNGTKNFSLFFEELNKMPTKSLQMTIEVLDTRKCLETQLGLTLGRIQKQLMKMDELRKIDDAIVTHEEEAEKNKNYEVKVQVAIKERVAVEEKSALNCTLCQTTCHYPCNPNLWPSLCPAFWKLEDFIPDIKEVVRQIMSRTVLNSEQSPESVRTELFFDVAGLFIKAAKNFSTLTCKVCEGNCPSQVHANENTRWECGQVEEMRTLDDVRQEYEKAMGKKSNAEELKNYLQNEIENLNSEILESTEIIAEYRNVLNVKALLRGDPLTTVDYIAMMIENEKEEKKPGYEEKIKSLENVLKKAKLQAEHSC